MPLPAAYPCTRRELEPVIQTRERADRSECPSIHRPGDCGPLPIGQHPDGLREHGEQGGGPGLRRL